MKTVLKDLRPNTEAAASSQGVRMIMDLFDVGPGVAVSTILVSLLVIGIGVTYFVQSAPPKQITISTGPKGSNYEKNALKYKEILEKNGVKVNVVNSEGSFDNLKALTDKNSKVDLAFVQAGLTVPGSEDLVSLGSVSYQPIMVFYRGPSLDLLSSLTGKRVAIGPEGSGTRKYALSILELNEIKEGGTTTLLNWEGAEAAQALKDGKLDAAFVMSESSSSDVVHELLRSQEIHLYNFKRAHGYSRKLENLNVLEMPEGVLDFGLNIPSQDIYLLGPMVELIAKKNFHPALTDLVLEAATQVHSKSGVYQKRGEFPASIEHAITLSPDALRFHQSGKGWLYRFLPFWLASLLTRLTVVVLPMMLFLIPVLKSIPAFFRWKTQMAMRRHYRNLLVIEKKFVSAHDLTEREALRLEFDRIERAVNKMRVRAAFADQFYSLRGHIDYVRGLVTKVAA